MIEIIMLSIMMLQIEESPQVVFDEENFCGECVPKLLINPVDSEYNNVCILLCNEQRYMDRFEEFRWC